MLPVHDLRLLWRHQFARSLAGADVAPTARFRAVMVLMTKSVVFQLVEHPAVFGGDLFLDRALEVLRKDAPGVGLDLEVIAGGGMPAAPGEGFLDVCMG